MWTRRAWGWAWLGLSSVLGLGCGASSASSTPARTPHAEAASALPPGIDPDRVLGPSATFGDLVRAARHLAGRGERDSSAPCLLRAAGGGYVLGADLMPAIAGASETESELDARLQRGGSVAALTAFGVHGAPDAAHAFEAWTAIAPERLRLPFALIALTDEGAYVLREPGASGTQVAAMPVAAVGSVLASPAQPAVCYVSAEPQVALEQLAELLSALPATCQAVLGTLLPEGTRLPAPPTSVDPPRCPEGLPELPAIAVEGDLPVAALREGVSGIAPGARRCLQYAASAAASGIAIRLALRIDPRGTVERACVLSASLASTPFESCVLEAARTASFTPPSPSGYVDVHAPLTLIAEPWPVQRGFCPAER